MATTEVGNYVMTARTNDDGDLEISRNPTFLAGSMKQYHVQYDALVTAFENLMTELSQDDVSNNAALELRLHR